MKDIRIMVCPSSVISNWHVTHAQLSLDENRQSKTTTLNIKSQRNTEEEVTKEDKLTIITSTY